MLISVDSGKANTKYFGGGIVGKFGTKMTVNDEVIKGIDKNSFNIVVDNILYKIGDTADSKDLEISKNKDIHRIAILSAINLVNKDKNFKDFELVTGTPISLFFGEERYRIAENLKKKFLVLWENEVREINIKKVLVVPETMGFIYNNYSNFKNKLVKVVDIGGLNTNGCIYINGKPVRESLFTINTGGHILVNEIKKELNREGYNYQDYEVEYLLSSNSGNIVEQNIISEIVRKHLLNIIQNMRANNWNIDSGVIHFTGGCSKVLKGVIKDYFSEVNISDDSIFDNVKGFYKIGEAMI